MTVPANLNGPSLGGGIVIDITTNQTNFSLVSALAALGIDATTSPVPVTVIVETGVILASVRSGPSYGFSTAGMAAGSTLTLINKGQIVGGGGAGGAGGACGGLATGCPGGPGWAGFNCTIPTRLDNTAGTIAGGGGGGGGAGGGYGGGGGGGAGYGPYGNMNLGTGGGGMTDGTLTLGGTGGTGGTNGGNGGAGGNLATAGTAGQCGDYNTNCGQYPGGAGGAAGPAIAGSSNITWSTGSPNGTITGALA